MRILILALILSINLTVWGNWSTAADNLRHTRSASSYIPPIINSDGSAVIIVDPNKVTAYGRASGSNWNTIGELFITDLIVNEYDSFDLYPLAHTSSLDKFALYKSRTSAYDGASGSSRIIPPKITILEYEGSIWSASEFSLPEKYGFIYDVGFSKNGKRIAIITSDESEDNFLYHSKILVYENILGSWILVGEPINYRSHSTRGIHLDENGDNIIIGFSRLENTLDPNFPVKAYTFSNGSWTQKGQNIYPKEDSDRHGWAVAISGDGQRIAISSPNYNFLGKVDSGAVDIYQFNENNWQLIAHLGGEYSGDLFGYEFSFSDNGNRIAIGSSYHDNDSGHIRIFDYNPTLNDYIPLGNHINGTEYESIGERFVMSGDGTIIVSINASWAAPMDSNSGVVTDTLKTYKFSVPIGESLDSDGDGLTNATEISIGTNPNSLDTDGDGLPDGWEVSRNLNPKIYSSDFINNINAYGYYSTDQIKDLRPSSTMIEVSEGRANITMTLEETSDLTDWTNATTSEKTIEVDAPSGTRFYRFKMTE